MTTYTRNTLSGSLAPVDNELEKIEVSLREKLDRNPSVAQNNEMLDDLDMNSNRIINYPDAVNDSDLITKGQVASLAPVQSVDGQTGNVLSRVQSVDGQVGTVLSRVQSVNGQTGNVSIPTQIQIDNGVVFDNISEMKSSSLEVGQLVRCKRYYAGSDLVEGLEYEIQATQAVDGYVDHALANGNIAKLINVDTLNIKQAGAVGDTSTDDTLAIQNAINTKNSIFFPTATYAVQSITFNKRGANYSGNPTFFGISATPLAAIVELVERNVTFDSLNVQQFYSDKYTSAMKWHSLSAGAPAQYCKIKEMKIEGAIIGILFGQISPTTVIDAPQSENSIMNFHTRGTQIPIYMNQPNGYLMISNSVINCLRNEWEVNNPGIYSYADSRSVECYQGVLKLSNSELLKTDTQLGYGVEMFGGALFLDNVSAEMASTNFYFSSSTGGSPEVYISNSYLFFSNAGSDYLVIEPTATGVLSISNSKIERPSSAANANKPFINHNGNDIISIKLSNITLENFIRGTEFRGFNGCNTHSFNTQITNFLNLDGDATRANNRIGSNDKGDNILLSRNVDTSTDTTDGWFLQNFFGGGTTISIVADAAATSDKEKKLLNALELLATGEARVSTVDNTSLTTIKATAIPVSEGTLLLCSARLRATTIGSYRRFGVAFYDITGATLTYSHLSNATLDIDGTWRYFEGVIEAPIGAKYAAINVSAGSSTVLITDARLKVLT